ncbi:conserved hypothetical protein [Flavobacterium sp. 9AF]|uniref:tetratricopeptide repeat protein n=1 Tax=Flavobacterium sp. 9AF TaxID=2653142 RepID=UPI0012EFB67E|nr:tetratricopeptide repeat protein [Flavobacterium sp. 9AF]VXC41408.1 conserved hypothetical protein [Flavobacterium sp. 9AF]
MKFIFSLIFFIIPIHSIFSCINGETKILKNGIYLYYVDYYSNSIPKGFQFYNIDLDKTKEQLQAEFTKTKNLDYLSDIGLILILQRKYNEALNLYLDIEKKEPNRYSTASNLGTLYELLGKDQQALEWIQKSYQINPASHTNSEWIHINILKSKIKVTSEGQEIASNSLINTNFGVDDYPETTLQKTELSDLKNQIYYQLNERISFIKPKDKVVATLLYDLANIHFLLKSEPKIYLKLYQMAEKYGYNKMIIKNRLSVINGNILKKEVSNTKNTFKITDYKNTFFLILALFLVLFLIFKLKK